mmetsp:Transcript_15655/g.19090  ORF Transcript_15655/g.19090 Transcript_15655/m.19090 type:complete len:239 (+) Transcript_15655:1060-1776(+)
MKICMASSRERSYWWNIFNIISNTQAMAKKVILIASMTFNAGMKYGRLSSTHRNRMMENDFSGLCKKLFETVIFLIGTKVTGDCHVPMKKISFGGLIYPEINDIFPSSNENRSREGRDGGVTLTTTAFPRINPAVTDFMNDGTYHRVLQSWPGWGTLSYQDFVRPHWARAEIVDVASSNSHQESAFSRMPTVAPTVSNTITATKQDGSSSSSDPKEVFGMVWNRHSAIILTRMEEEKR